MPTQKFVPTNRKSDDPAQHVQFDVPESSVEITDVLSGIYKGAQDLDEGLELTGYLHSINLSSCEPENMDANGRKSVPRCGIHEINIITKDDELQLPIIREASKMSMATGVEVRSGRNTRKNKIWRTTLGRKLNGADVAYFIAVSAAEYAKQTKNVVFFLTVEGIWQIFIKSSPIALTQSLVDAINTIFKNQSKSTLAVSEEIDQLFKEFGITGHTRFRRYSIPSENKHSRIAPQSESLTLKKFVAMQASQRKVNHSLQRVQTMSDTNLQSRLWTLGEFATRVKDLEFRLVSDTDEIFPDPQLFSYCRDFVIRKRDGFIANDDDFGYRTKMEILYDIQQNIGVIYPFFPLHGENISEVSIREAVDAVMQKLPVVHRDDIEWRRVVYDTLNIWVWAVYFGVERDVNGTHEAGSTLEFDPLVHKQFIEITGDVLKPGDRFTVFVPAMPVLVSEAAIVAIQEN